MTKKRAAPAGGLLSVTDVAGLLHICTPTLWRWRQRIKDFPELYSPGPGCVGRFKEDEIKAWMDSRKPTTNRAPQSAIDARRAA